MKKKIICAIVAIIILALVYVTIKAIEHIKRCFDNAYAEEHMPSPRAQVHFDKSGVSTLRLSLPGEALFKNGGEIYFEFTESKPEPPKAFFDSLDKSEIHITITNTKGKIVSSQIFAITGKSWEYNIPLPVNRKKDLYCLGRKFINLNSDNVFYIDIAVKKPILWLQNKPHYMFLQYDTMGYWEIMLLFHLVCTEFLVFLLVLIFILICFYTKKIETKKKLVSITVSTIIMLIILHFVIWYRVSAMV